MDMREFQEVGHGLIDLLADRLEHLPHRGGDVGPARNAPVLALGPARCLPPGLEQEAGAVLTPFERRAGLRYSLGDLMMRSSLRI